MSLRKYDEGEHCLFSYNEIVTKFKELTWLRIAEARDSFYVTRMSDKLKYKTKHYKVGVHDLGASHVRQIAPHPLFWEDKFMFLAVMNDDYEVSIRRVAIDKNNLNQNLTIEKREAGVNYLEMYGNAEKATVVGLKHDVKDQKTVIWFKTISTQAFN